MERNVSLYPKDRLDSPMSETENYRQSVLGLANLTNSKNSARRRIAWAIIISSFCGLSVFQIAERLLNYYNEPVNLIVEYRSPGKIDFPSVTFCPYHGFFGKRIQEELKKRAGNNSTVHSVYDLLSFPDLDLEAIWNLTEIDLISSDLNCIYEVNKHCHFKQFWTKHYTVLGLCYTLTMSSNYTYSGVSSGLNVGLRHLYGHTSETPLSLLVSLHHRTSDVSYSALVNGILLNIGTAMQITFYHREIYVVNTRRKPCYPKEVFQHCRTQCYDNLFAKTLGCRLPFMKQIDLPLCTDPETFQQMYPIPIYASKQIDDMTKKCKKKCRRPCHSFDYYPYTDTRLGKSNVSYVFLNPLTGATPVLRERRSYTFDALVCDIGAVLGLYIGISALTVVEALEFVFDSIRQKFTSKQ